MINYLHLNFIALDANADFTILWILLSGILVFFMQAGFTLVESGFTRSKNAVNISMKNVLDISVGTISYWIIGYGLMYGASNGYIATSDIFLTLETGHMMFSSKQYFVQQLQQLFLVQLPEELNIQLTFSLPFF